MKEYIKLPMDEWTIHISTKVAENEEKMKALLKYLKLDLEMTEEHIIIRSSASEATGT